MPYLFREVPQRRQDRNPSERVALASALIVALWLGITIGTMAYVGHELTAVHPLVQAPGGAK